MFIAKFKVCKSPLIYITFHLNRINTPVAFRSLVCWCISVELEWNCKRKRNANISSGNAVRFRTSCFKNVTISAHEEGFSQDTHPHKHLHVFVQPRAGDRDRDRDADYIQWKDVKDYFLPCNVYLNRSCFNATLNLRNEGRVFTRYEMCNF